MATERRDLRKVSVTILSWNGRHHLEVCLAALREQKDPGVPWEILVLDNGSSDGTADWLRREHSRVRLIESRTNLGFCAGTNRLVVEAAGDGIALLNNDTRPKSDWLAALVDAFRAAPDDVAAVSGCIVDWQGERLDFGRGVMTFDGHAFQLGFGSPLASAEIPEEGTELPFACGGNMLVKKESFLGAGGFDEAYFAYLEDVDLGWRLWAGGERVTFTPAAVVHHRSSATSDLLGLYNRGFLFERNAFLTAYKNYEDGLWEKVMPVVLLTLLSREQTLLETHNPGGHLLTLDPYAGLIANTGGGAAAEDAGGLGEASRWRRWRGYGPRELVGRAFLKMARKIWPQAPDLARAVSLSDERTMAQLRAQSYLLRHLEAASEKRAAAQRRRRRPDRAIFDRFPAYLVPTYPGDEALFQDPGFRRWLPEDLPVVESTLERILSGFQKKDS